MTGACVRGVGLSCALGADAETCVAAMLHETVRPSELRLERLSESLRMPYYRMPDRGELFDSGRMQRLLPPVVHAAVAQAGLTAVEICKLPLFIGSSCFSIGESEARYSKALALESPDAMPMSVCGYQDIAKLVQQTLGCEGETYTYNTACTASANAMLGALRMLELGWHRQALVVGVELANLTTLAGFSGLQIIAETLRPFDAKRAGLVLGEGIGAVLLSAEESVNAPRIRGGASNCDTFSVTTANPDGKSVAAVLQQALQQAQVQPQQVRGIKAHGTATPMGDTAEALGIRKIFTSTPPVCVLKPYLGHTLGACCVNELVLFAGALQQGILPATPGFEAPDSAFELQPIKHAVAAPDGCYLLNHFGFGGNNAVLVLEKTTR
ncbi:MAG: beta-ketoacyl synthase N-terminal-like domain-containing protein [Gammaproteobacteria bacterium]